MTASMHLVRRGRTLLTNPKRKRGGWI